MADNIQPVADQVDDFDSYDPSGVDETVDLNVAEPQDPVEETPQEEVQETEEAPEGEVQEEKQEKESEKSEKEGEGSEVDLFDDVEIDGETEEVSTDLKELAESLGITDVKSKSDLVLEVAKMKAKAESSEPTYANKELATFATQLNEIAKNGGDWKAYYSKEQEIQSKTKQLEKIDKFVSGVKQLKSKGSVAQLKEVLVQYQEEQFLDENGNYDGPEGFLAEYRESLDDQTDLSIRTEAYKVLNSALDAKSRAKENLEGTLAKFRESQESAVEAARAQKEEFQKQVRASIASYKDEVSEKYTRPIQKLATEAWNTGDVNVTIPKGIADALLLGEDGNLSPEKVIASLGKVAYSSNQIQHLKKKTKVQAFRELQDVGRGNVAKQAESAGSSDFDDFEGYEVPEGFRRD